MKPVWLEIPKLQLEKYEDVKDYTFSKCPNCAKHKNCIKFCEKRYIYFQDIIIGLPK